MTRLASTSLLQEGMTANDAFIRELLKAANEVDRLHLDERSRLAQRANTVISGYEDAIGSNMPLKQAAGRTSAWLRSFARMPHYLSNEEASRALLEAVRVIRDLERKLGPSK